MDNFLVLLLPIQPLVGQYQVVPNVFLTCLAMFVFFDKGNKPYWLALAFGLLYDIFYAGLLGLYPVLFVGTVFILRKYFVGITPINLFSMIFLMWGVIAVNQWVIYFLVLTMTASRMGFMHFVQYLLFPALLFNGIFMLATYPFLVSQFRKYKKKFSG